MVSKLAYKKHHTSDDIVARVTICGISVGETRAESP